MVVQKLLNATGLAPPGPLELIMDEVQRMTDGEFLCVRIDREPFLIYPILNARGYKCETQIGSESNFEVLIWKKGDLEVEREMKRRN